MMGISTDEMKNAIAAIRLCFVATVSPDGKPNLSAKGSLCVWDDDHLLFADIASPQTMKNLETNPYVEINTVDQIGRRGFRFKGTAEILYSGEVFTFLVNDIHAREGTGVPVNAAVKVRVSEARPLLSPAYFLIEGVTEAQVRSVWMGRYGYRLAGPA
jgi:predicted pyridoxine 5'-phosphate oxidase superfamily flavin-nucleotide-binding protein